MVYYIDTFGPQQKRAYVISTTFLGAFLSTLTFGLRLLARRMVGRRFYHEDWWMLGGLLTSYGIGAMTIWGYAAAGGEHEATVRSHPNGLDVIKSCLTSVWIIQRLYPPAHLFIKTSIIIFYVRIFQTRIFRRVGWVVWTYTLLWSIQAQLASLLECSPPAYFYDRAIEGGHCVANPLINISLTESVLNTIGDMIIFLMPVPMLKHLHVDSRKKKALFGIFALGLFVTITSIVRWVALLGTAEDITSSLVTSSIWTYLEVSMAITCGNLPLLAPVFGKVFQRIRTPSGHSKHNSQGHRLTDNSYKSRAKTQESISPTLPHMRQPQRSQMMYPEEALLDDSSEETLNEQPSYSLEKQKVAADRRRSNGILVQKEIAVSYLNDPNPNTTRATKNVGMHALPPHSSATPPSSFISRAWSEP